MHAEIKMKGPMYMAMATKTAPATSGEPGVELVVVELVLVELFIPVVWDTYELEERSSGSFVAHT